MTQAKSITERHAVTSLTPPSLPARPIQTTQPQNGLRNQFDATPYKPLTAHCESAQKIQNPKKSETTQQPKQQTKPAKPPNALSRTTQKTPKFTPDSNPQNPKKTPVLTHPALSLSPHAPTYLSTKNRPQKEADTPPVTRDSRIKSAWFTPSAGRGLYQPPF